jgi:4-alpha-glucanotransferase
MSALDDRAARAGILSEYRDLFGVWRETSADTKAALLAALGLSETDAPEPERALPRWHICEPSEGPELTAAPWSITYEDGTEGEGQGPLPPLPLGRHRLAAGGEVCWLLVAPARLPLPARSWGLMVPLAGLRPATVGGIGGYGDLARMAEGAARQGAAFLGINPIHAGFPADPGAFSPYTPSHRRRFASVYLDTDGAPGGDLIDFGAETPARMAALEVRFAAEGDDPAFAAWRAEQGAGLDRFATYQALSERFGAYWDTWPVAYQTPEDPKVAQAAREMADRVDFHAWLQFQAETALGAARDRAAGAGMALGLYLDLAVGTHPHGAETWEDRDTFAFGASLGAPPDAFAPQGQNWQLAPFNPVKLIDTGFEALAATLRQQLRFAGALRIDHILGFERAYLVPDGLPGAYVQMPRDAMLAVARIEAARAGAVIVGEDLGVIPDGLQQALQDSGILGCRLACFEHREDPPVFKRPENYDEPVIASFTTHDLPTWKGWRDGREISVRRDIGLTPPEHAQGMFDWRGREVSGFDWLTGQYRGDAPPESAEAMWSVLAATRSRLAAVQVEDVLGLSAQPNLPGTVSEYPNWRQRLPSGPDEIAGHPWLVSAAAIMARSGR